MTYSKKKPASDVVSSMADSKKKPVSDVVLNNINRIIDEYEGGSVQEFCRKIAINQANYYTWVKRDSPPEMEAQKITCDVYGVTMEWLGTREAPIPERPNKEKRGQETSTRQSKWHPAREYVGGRWDGCHIPTMYDNIELFCQINGISLTDFAEKLGLDDSFINGMEVGRIDVGVDVVQRIADHFRVKRWELGDKKFRKIVLKHNTPFEKLAPDYNNLMRMLENQSEAIKGAVRADEMRAQAELVRAEAEKMREVSIKRLLEIAGLVEFSKDTEKGSACASLA